MFTNRHENSLGDLISSFKMYNIEQHKCLFLLIHRFFSNEQIPFKVIMLQLAINLPEKSGRQATPEAHVALGSERLAHTLAHARVGVVGLKARLDHINRIGE